MIYLQNYLQEARDSLDKIKKISIGLFFYLGEYYFIIKNKNDKYDLLHGITITKLGAINELHIQKEQVKVAFIPEEYDSFYHLLDEPNVYFNWFKQNFK